MVCMGWEDKFDALNGGAHGGGRSFFTVANGICEVTAETVESAMKKTQLLFRKITSSVKPRIEDVSGL